MTCVEPQRMRMTRSFNHYTDGNRVYLSKKLKIFLFRVMGCLNGPHREQAHSYREPCAPHHYCGSQPAGDGGVLVHEDVETNGLIASRLAPTGSRVRHITIVGASLLAMAVYQSTKMLKLMASSQAGSLPHLIV